MTIMAMQITIHQQSVSILIAKKTAIGKPMAVEGYRFSVRRDNRVPHRPVVLRATLNQPVVCIDSGANSGRFIVSEALRLDFRSTRVLRLGLRPAFPHYGRTCAINRLRER